MSMFRRLGMANFGATGVDLITITNQTINADGENDIASSRGIARYTLGANGGVVISSTTVATSVNNYTTLLDTAEWINNKNSASNYSVKATWTGSNTAGSTALNSGGMIQNTWYALTTERSYTLNTGLTTGFISASYTINISIAKTSDTSTILETATIILNASALGTA